MRRRNENTDGFMRPCANKPEHPEVPMNYKTILMKARTGLMKTHRRLTTRRKRALVKNIIEMNDIIINSLT